VDVAHTMQGMVTKATLKGGIAYAMAQVRRNGDTRRRAQRTQ
jgi:hypothetical protein